MSNPQEMDPNQLASDGDDVKEGVEPPTEEELKAAKEADDSDS